MKEKMVYQEGYKKPYPGIAPEFLPKCSHVHASYECFEARIMKAGVVERGGDKFEFQDVRLYFKES